MVKVSCTCGNQIDVSGVIPAIETTSVFCIVCGRVLEHKL